MVEVINTIYETLQAKWQREGKSKAEQIEAWNDYVPKNLLPRLYGFELMMAPYSIAHMKIGLKLSETGYRFLSSERAQIYLTNTLEEAKEIQPYFETMSPALAHEAKAANRVKEETPITVVVGNPPYSRESFNSGQWIENLMEVYKTSVRGQESQIQALSNDYIKFLRFAEYTVSKYATTRGVIGLITGHGYLHGTQPRDLRQHLAETFNNIDCIDLHGSVRRDGTDDPNDEPVFEIMTGVAIFVGTRNFKAVEMTSVKSANLTGKRDYKFQILSSHSTLKNSFEWDSHIPVSPFYNFTKFQSGADIQEEYYSYREICSFFGTGNRAEDKEKFWATGFATQQDDLAIAFTKSELLGRMEELKSASSFEQLRKRYRLCSTNQWNFSDAKQFAQKGDFSQHIQLVDFRPFDSRWTIYHKHVLTITRNQVMQQLMPRKNQYENLALITSRAVNDLTFAHSFVANKPVDKIFISSKTSTNAYVFPLYLYPTEREKAFGATERVPNFSEEFIDELAEKLGSESYYDDEHGNPDNDPDTFTPEDVFHYAYAVFHSPTYRARYAEFLKIDFPRLPLTTDRELFDKLGDLGEQLVKLHLLESVHAPADWKLHQDGAVIFQNTTVASGFPKKELADVDENGKGKVYINKSTYFDGIPESVFNFHIGGYQVCHKWLKDRKDRELSAEDIEHYGKITVALAGTIRLMADIDEVIEEHGGFPLVGSQT